MAAGAIMAPGAKQLARGEKHRSAESARVPCRLPDPGSMKHRAKTFTLTHLRCEDEMIVEVKGRGGFWPMRRPVRYRLGGNCDAITVTEGRLVVYRDGSLIAFADLQHPGASRWGWLLFPRHMRADPPSGPPRD